MTTILLIDLSSILHPLFHTTTGSSNPNECSIQTVARVRALASGQPFTAICCDSGRSFRRDISPDYKANRPERDATLAHQMTLAVETLKADGFPVWAMPRMEADDLIATAATTAVLLRHQTEPVDDRHVIIATSDKDLFQLVSDRVTVHRVADTKKALQVTPDVVREEYGIEPSQMRDYLALVGDSSDNIKGADGIGPKKAAAMLARYGNLDDLYAAIDKGETFLPATLKALTEFRPRLDTVRALVALRTDVPLPFEEVFKERVPTDVAVFEGEDSMTETEEPNGMGVKVAPSQPTQAVLDPVGPSAPSPIDPMAKLAQDTPKQAIVAPAVASQTGLAIRDEVLPLPSSDLRWQLEPRSQGQAIELAKHMHASRLFSVYGTPQAVLSTIMAGREIGLQAMASLRAFHIIDGKQAQSADLIRAQCLRSPLCEYFRIVERTATKATWVTKRKGDPEVPLTYTIEEGRQAWQKDQKAWDASAWGKRPANMVTKTAAATLARLVYPDLVLNMYCPEELTGEEVS